MDALPIIGIVLNGALAVVAVLSLRDNHKQIKEGKEQARIAQAEAVEARQDQHRPLLILLHGQTGTNIAVSNGQLDYSHASQYVAYKNVGSGVAINIQGWVYGYIPENYSLQLATRFQFEAQEPLPKDGEKGYNARSNTLHFTFEDKIGDYSLLAPKGMIARVTLTYHDIFNRKHAAIFDLNPDGGWISRGFPKIDKDLADLDKETGQRIAQANQAVLDAAAQRRAIQPPN
ncbi:MAG TPA: hypothetical protein VH599_13425 [Ktedonobacterales bacterium]|jgi:hypothetical protein